MRRKVSRRLLEAGCENVRIDGRYASDFINHIGKGSAEIAEAWFVKPMARPSSNIQPSRFSTPLTAAASWADASAA